MSSNFFSGLSGHGQNPTANGRRVNQSQGQNAAGPSQPVTMQFTTGRRPGTLGVGSASVVAPSYQQASSTAIAPSTTAVARSAPLSGHTMTLQSAPASKPGSFGPRGKAQAAGNQAPPLVLGKRGGDDIAAPSSQPASKRLHSNAPSTPQPAITTPAPASAATLQHHGTHFAQTKRPGTFGTGSGRSAPVAAQASGSISSSAGPTAPSSAPAQQGQGSTTPRPSPASSGFANGNATTAGGNPAVGAGPNIPASPARQAGTFAGAVSSFSGAQGNASDAQIVASSAPSAARTSSVSVGAAAAKSIFASPSVPAAPTGAISNAAFGGTHANPSPAAGFVPVQHDQASIDETRNVAQPYIQQPVPIQQDPMVALARQFAQLAIKPIPASLFASAIAPTDFLGFGAAFDYSLRQLTGQGLPACAHPNEGPWLVQAVAAEHPARKAYTRAQLFQTTEGWAAESRRWLAQGKQLLNEQVVAPKAVPAVLPVASTLAYLPARLPMMIHPIIPPAPRRPQPVAICLASPAEQERWRRAKEAEKLRRRHEAIWMAGERARLEREREREREWERAARRVRESEEMSLSRGWQADMEGLKRRMGLKTLVVAERRETSASVPFAALASASASAARLVVMMPQQQVESVPSVDSPPPSSPPTPVSTGARWWDRVVGRAKEIVTVVVGWAKGFLVG